MTKTKIIAAVAVGALALSGVAGALGHAIGDNGISQQDIDAARIAAYKAGAESVTPEDGITQSDVDAAFEAGVNSVEPSEPVVINNTIVEEVEVIDKELTAQLCDRLVFDDVSECVEEVQAEDAALKLAISEIEDNFADELEDANIVRDEDRVEIVSIYDDYEDVVVKKSDFDDEEYKFVIEAKIDDDKADKKLKVAFTVTVEDGEAEIVKVEKV